MKRYNNEISDYDNSLKRDNNLYRPVKLMQVMQDRERNIILASTKLGIYLINIAEKAIGEEKMHRDNTRLIRYIKKMICRPLNALAQCSWYGAILKNYPYKYIEPNNWRAHLRFQHTPYSDGLMHQHGYYIKTNSNGEEELAYSEELYEASEKQKMLQNYINRVTTRFYFEGIDRDESSMQELDKDTFPEHAMDHFSLD